MLVKSPRVNKNAAESQTLDRDEPTIRHELADLQVSELQARVAALEEELAGARTTEVSDDHVVVRQSGLEDIRNAYAETLLRLPRSERLQEMRALSEKVLSIGMVKSRRRKPKVTAAAAQTTEVEPASEFDVEPDALEAARRHQSETVNVGETINIPGVVVADTKRRKRKPKATKPADDAS
jgi:uncharacterized small protein (DUF1192 family)